MNVEFNIRIIEQLNDETDPQERADKIAYDITSVLSDSISVEATLIQPDDVKTTIQMQRLIEDLTEEELTVLKKFYIKLSKLSESETDLYTSHSIDEANQVHKEKSRIKKRVKKEA